MGAKYCKENRCPENNGNRCALCDECMLFKWDIEREKCTTLRENCSIDKSIDGDKSARRGANQPHKTGSKRCGFPLEEEEQRDFAAWCDARGILWAHIPNERKASIAVLSSLARQGLKKGFPDNFIAVARGKWHGLFIELKRAKKCLSQRSAEQRAWIRCLNAAGYKALFCYGAEEAKKAVSEYLKEV